MNRLAEYAAGPLPISAMQTLVSEVPYGSWAAKGPQTPAQRFFADYAAGVDSGSYKHGSRLEWDSSNLVYHNCNGVVYHGGDQMWAWMKTLFAPFSGMQQSDPKRAGNFSLRR